MSIKLIQDRLDSYNCNSEIEEEQALREITQEIALAALGRTDFFAHAAFQGGTCLRIFYGLNRFSEDLDFILNEPDSHFQLLPHMKTLEKELAAYGYTIEITDRSNADAAVKKAFLKDDSLVRILHLNHAYETGPPRKIRIKFEVDTNPPSGGGTEIKYIDFPFVSSLTAQDTPSLFAGKIHALLCREYAKGRDWYDFLWYAGRKTVINYPFLASALKQQGPWAGRNIDVGPDWCLDELEMKIRSLDWEATVRDVRRFVKSPEQPSLELWGEDLFLSMLEKLRG